MTVNFRGYVFQDDGDAVNGATVQLLETGTTTVEASTTTDSDGLWYFNEADQDRYDVKITSGTSVRYVRWDDQVSFKEIDVRNNTGATTPAATFSNLTNSTANQVAVFSGANSTKADNDEIYISFKMHDSAGNLDEFARMTAVATDVTSGSEDGQIEFDVIKAGTLTKVWTITSSTGAAMSFDMNVDALTIGSGADTDVSLTFDANSADGVITWMEDEDYFKFSDDILMNSTERINFYDTAIYIYSSTDGQLDLVADTEIQIAATTIDINGAVALNGAITGATDITLSGELDAATLDLSSSADIAGDLVLSGGADGALQFTNAGENSIKIPDNQASALIIEEADNAYITFVTTNSSEAITVAKATTFSAGIADAGTIAAGTWNGTDVGVAYGGTGASSLTDGGVLLGSGTGAITAMAVLSDGEMIVGDGTTDPVAESGATLRTSIGVGTGDSPQFTGIELGHASDTTIVRSGSGDITIEGNAVYRAGGTDVAVADGGTGASSLTDGGVLLGSGTSAVTAMAVLADSEMIVGNGSTDPVAESGATLRTSIGVGTGDSPQFTAIELGHASDTTIARSGSGAITVEGTQVLLAGAALTGTTGTFSGVLDITDTTDSSDATGDTGALRTEGGASIAKKLYVGTDLDVDGTTNLDAVDIDGNVQLDGAFTIGVDDAGHDFKAFGATAGAYMMWDQSEDKLIIDQSTDDAEALILRSSTDVDHGFTSGFVGTSTETYFSVRKMIGGSGDGTGGGAILQAFAGDTADKRVLSFYVGGGTADTTKTTSGVGLVDYYIVEHNGSNGMQNITADGNVFAIRARVGGSTVARLIVDEDGDLYSVTSAQTFDQYDDAQMVRALDQVKGDVIRDKWDDYVTYNEQALIDADVLGGPISEGGMTNVTQLQRLHNGAIWQGYVRQQELQERVEELETKLLALEGAK